MSNETDAIYAKLRSQSPKVQSEQELAAENTDLITLEEMKDTIKVTVAANSPERALLLLKRAKRLIKGLGGYDSKPRIDKSGNS